MMAATQNDGMRMPKVPGEHSGLSFGCHSHHDQIRQVRTAVCISLTKLQSQFQFIICWCFKTVNPVCYAGSKGQGGIYVPARSQEKIYLNENWPRYDNLATQTPKQLRRKLVPASFSAVDCRYQRPGIADNQLDAARLRIFSTCCERSSSSSTNPA